MLSGETGLDEDGTDDAMAAAAVALGHLVDAAASRLSRLPQPAAIAADPYVMDNRGDMSEWLAVQLGREKWIVRRGQDTMGLPTHNDLATAHDALMFLEQARWRELAATAFQRPGPNPAAAVVFQHGTQWLIVDNRLVFLIGRSSELLPVGEIYGFSARLGKPNPVLLDVVEPDAWDALFAAMPGFPVETLVRGHGIGQVLD